MIPVHLRHTSSLFTSINLAFELAQELCAKLLADARLV